MSNSYSTFGSDTNTDNTTIIQLTGGTGVRPAIYDIIVSSRAAPNDYAVGYEFNRSTAAGTGGSAPTPQKLDPGSPAAETTVLVGPTGEGTYTANEVVLFIAKNMRVTYRWIAAPRGELIIPATASNGIGMVADTPTTAYSEFANIHWFE